MNFVCDTCKKSTLFLFYNKDGSFSCSKECQKISSPMNMREITIHNKSFRNILYSSDNMQIVLMSLKPKGVINKEIHENITQFITIQYGSAIIELYGNEYDKNPSSTIKLKSGGSDTFIILPNTFHKVLNNSDTEYLKLYTIYSSKIH